MTHPELATMEEIVLGNVESILSAMYRGLERPCTMCGRTIAPGHTAFTLICQPGRSHTVCYECGEATLAHLGFSTLMESPTCNAYGGPSSPFIRPATYVGLPRRRPPTNSR